MGDQKLTLAPRGLKGVPSAMDIIRSFIKLRRPSTREVGARKHAISRECLVFSESPGEIDGLTIIRQKPHDLDRPFDELLKDRQAGVALPEGDRDVRVLSRYGDDLLPNG